VTGEGTGALDATAAAAGANPDAASGLDDAAVAARVKAGLVNEAPPAPGRSISQILRANVATRFNAILGTLFVIVIAVGPPQDALFGVVLVINTGVGVFQEIRAKRLLDRLAILTAPKARVLRGGEVIQLATGGIVQDDVLDLRIGDQVPVDAAGAGAGTRGDRGAGPRRRALHRQDRHADPPGHAADTNRGRRRLAG